MSIEDNGCGRIDVSLEDKLNELCCVGHCIVRKTVNIYGVTGRLSGISLGNEQKRKYILDRVSELAYCLMHYDRVDDTELPPGAIENAMFSGIISIEEIATEFCVCIINAINCDVEYEQ